MLVGSPKSVYLCIRFGETLLTSVKRPIVNTLSYRTESAKKEQVQRRWYVVDAEGQVVGRICSQIAAILRGKHRPDYTPHVDTGDYVIILNADKVRFTGKKMLQKQYLTYSLYPGGQKSRTPADVLAKKPERILEHAIKGMLPKTKLGRAMYRKLFIYNGAEHPHGAQKPEPLKF
ncbi:MAG: 50S ribosomal protein L13 [Saprospiraceae bacterium]|nr:50S ribosomal protein L13 [Saprospiraceae bacterium]